jgi:hypothetical protein
MRNGKTRPTTFSSMLATRHRKVLSSSLHILYCNCRLFSASKRRPWRIGAKQRKHANYSPRWQYWQYPGGHFHAEAGNMSVSFNMSTMATQCPYRMHLEAASLLVSSGHEFRGRRAVLDAAPYPPLFAMSCKRLSRWGGCAVGC